MLPAMTSIQPCPEMRSGGLCMPSDSTGDVRRGPHAARARGGGGGGGNRTRVRECFLEGLYVRIPVIVVATRPSTGRDERDASPAASRRAPRDRACGQPQVYDAGPPPPVARTEPTSLIEVRLLEPTFR